MLEQMIVLRWDTGKGVVLGVLVEDNHGYFGKIEFVMVG